MASAAGAPDLRAIEPIAARQFAHRRAGFIKR
jgi:hypothetical protein